MRCLDLRRTEVRHGDPRMQGLPLRSRLQIGLCLRFHDGHLRCELCQQYHLPAGLDLLCTGLRQPTIGQRELCVLRHAL